MKKPLSIEGNEKIVRCNKKEAGAKMFLTRSLAKLFTIP